MRRRLSKRKAWTMAHWRGGKRCDGEWTTLEHNRARVRCERCGAVMMTHDMRSGTARVRVLVAAVTMVWWLMTGWSFSPDSGVITGPFGSFGDCNAAGQKLPFMYWTSGWHCDAS